MSLITIITINFNNAKGLKKTIDSVVSQTFQDFEYIVIDGYSKDESVELIKQSPRIDYWVSEKDKGIYDAQNKGILQAKGKYLLFLNSGDVFASDDVLKNISKYLAGDKSFYFGNLLLEKNGVTEKHIAPSIINIDFILNSTLWHPCVFIKADLFKTYGLYNTAFEICGDYEFFVRCLIKPNITTEFINEFVTLFDGNGISNDPTKLELQKQEREKAWQENLSVMVYDAVKQYNRFSRSKFASIINSIQKLRGHKGYS
jgi:glycosyltransferase involved in cell wall biosynthesis